MGSALRQVLCRKLTTSRGPTICSGLLSQHTSHDMQRQAPQQLPRVDLEGWQAFCPRHSCAQAVPLHQPPARGWVGLAQALHASEDVQQLHVHDHRLAVNVDRLQGEIWEPLTANWCCLFGHGQFVCHCRRLLVCVCKLGPLLHQMKTAHSPAHSPAQPPHVAEAFSAKREHSHLMQPIFIAHLGVHI